MNFSDLARAGWIMVCCFIYTVAVRSWIGFSVAPTVSSYLLIVPVAVILYFLRASSSIYYGALVVVVVTDFSIGKLYNRWVIKKLEAEIGLEAAENKR
jgi:hypothetical protein